jgi:pimeloyl-ACP methyl ester carboxylesterase
VNQKRPTLIVFIAACLGLTACVSTPDYSGEFRAYEERFRRETPYVVHAVPRTGSILHAREFGARNPGPVLVFMHGFPDSLHLYDAMIPLLAHKRRIIAFDFLGWGESDKPVAHRYDSTSLRQDLEAIIAYFRLNDIVLVLHDASGPPGIDWAIDHPQLTAGLVLLNTYYGPTESLRPPEAIARFSTPGVQRDITVWMARHFDSLWTSGVATQLEKFFSNPESREKFIPLFVHQALAIRPAFVGLNAVLQDEVAGRETQRSRLSGFRPPVRIIFGKDDPYLNTGVAHDFAHRFPNVELFLVENAGHYVQLDQPGAVANLLRQFPTPGPVATPH